MLKRRLFLLLAVLLPLLGFAQAKSVPYFSQIGGASKLDADWTVYNVNGDEKTWINDASPSTYSSISAGQNTFTTLMPMPTTGWCRLPFILRQTRNTRFHFM